MKQTKPSYFKDELRKLFIEYTIVPAAAFTLICLALFIFVSLHTRLSGNEDDNRRISAELELALGAYENQVASLSLNPGLLDKTADQVPVFTRLYQLNNELSHNAELFILDREKSAALSSNKELPDFLTGYADVNWGVYRAMDEQPDSVTLQLLSGTSSSSPTWLALGKPILDDSGVILGYVVITLPDSEFRITTDTAETQTIITDSYGWIYLANNYTFLDNVHRVSRQLEEADGYLSVGNSQFLITQNAVCSGQLIVYSISDISDTVKSLLLCSGMMLTVLLAITVWVLISSKRVTEKKTEDFYTILNAMEKAREGNLDSPIRLKGENEFQILADAYQEMLDSLKIQMENNKKMADLVVSSQTRQLESQFNPHFLFNTLETIRYMYKIEPQSAEKMVLSLSGLLRYSLNNTDREVPLREDLGYLENYLTILNYRYNRRFTYTMDIAEEALGCLIPRLIVQPMIENAVKYGFGSRENLHVELKAYCHEEKLMIICRDDGVGMSAGTLEEVSAILSKEENQSSHFGLYNIHRRIQLLYGPPYGITLRSQEGYGTTLVITMPIRKEEETCLES